MSDPIRARLDDLLYGQNVDYVPYFPDLFWHALTAVLDLCDESDQGYDWSCFPEDIRRAIAEKLDIATD
jgi:hypothetical protein